MCESTMKYFSPSFSYTASSSSRDLARAPVLVGLPLSAGNFMIRGIYWYLRIGIRHSAPLPGARLRNRSRYSVPIRAIGHTAARGPDPHLFAGRRRQEASALARAVAGVVAQFPAQQLAGGRL